MKFSSGAKYLRSGIRVKNRAARRKHVNRTKTRDLHRSSRGNKKFGLRGCMRMIEGVNRDASRAYVLSSRAQDVFRVSELCNLAKLVHRMSRSRRCIARISVIRGEMFRESASFPITFAVACKYFYVIYNVAFSP